MTDRTFCIASHAPANRGAWRERGLMALSALAGAGIGALYSGPAVAWVAGVWTRHVLPAYDEMIRNGLLSWCF